MSSSRHEVDAAHAVKARLRTGQRQHLVIGVQLGTCTCQRPALEDTGNVQHERRESSQRGQAETAYPTDEDELGTSTSAAGDKQAWTPVLEAAEVPDLLWGFMSELGARRLRLTREHTRLLGG